MLYKCDNCGEVCYEEELGSYQECVGEFWGAPAYETFSCCPRCGSDEVYEWDEDNERYLDDYLNDDDDDYNKAEMEYYDELLKEMHLNEDETLDYGEDE